MKITIEFERAFKSSEDIAGFMNALAGVNGGDVTTKIAKDVVESKPKSKPKKEETPEETVEEVEEVAETEVETTVTYTLDDAKKLAKDKLRSHRQEISEILASFGVSKVTDLTDPNNITSFAEQVQALK